MPTPTIHSKLPHVGANIFSRMSALAAEHGAVNLGQGFPDFACDPALLRAVDAAMQAGHNQYPLMTGVPALREAVAAKVAGLYGHQYDAASEITITAGATQALTNVLMCAIHPGDEVIVIEPAYDSYLPAIALAGGTAVTVSMQLSAEGFSVPWAAVAQAITPRTRMIVLNTPHNPTGSILHQADLDALAALVQGTEILLLSDEVYEHMVYDGQTHHSISSHPALAERAFVVSSFGKTYHVTGWKVGYVAAPAALSAEFRRVHQYNVFSVNSPAQYGIASYMQDPAPYVELPAFYQRKRDLFRAGLAASRFELLPCDGTYFQCVRYKAISNLAEAPFAEWLTSHAKVAAIPLTPFFRAGQESGIVRFCFAKQDATLRLALERLQGL